MARPIARSGDWCARSIDDKGLLCGFLGGLAAAEHGVADAGDEVLVSHDQFAKGVSVAGETGGEKRGLFCRGRVVKGRSAHTGYVSGGTDS